MSEFNQELDYLRAQLAQAQQLDHSSTQVRTTKLQSLLDKFRVLSLRPVSTVKVTGYARSSELQMMHKGKLMTLRVRRVPNEWCVQPVYIDPNKEIAE